MDYAKNSDMRADYKPTAEEISRFSQKEKELREKLFSRKDEEKKRNPAEASYERLAERCGVSADLMKRIFLGTATVTREFILKFAYGLEMCREEADQYLELCGGRLDPDNRPEDMCFCACLRDNDPIEIFAEELKNLQKKINANSSR